MNQGLPQRRAGIDSQIEEILFRIREGWDDWVGDFQSAKVPGTFNAPSWSQFAGNAYGWKFSNTANNGLQVNLHCRHQYKPESLVYPHIHFAALNGGSGVVRWNCELYPMRGYSQLSAIPSPVLLTLDTTVTADCPHIITECSDAQAFNTEIEVDALILSVVYRDTSVAGNYTGGDIFGLYMDVHHEVDRFATPKRNVPFYDALV